ncbi:MAG TPA: hypothetical protein VMT30_08270 [Candidatus Saccharimonadia bacterium]|nr:hypothetical protein [Candidatus Saccharimonadia bacterium]
MNRAYPNSILKLIWRLLLPVRACFWVRNWIRWARTKFPDPPKDMEVAARLQTFIIVTLFFIAYAFYRSNQITSFTDLANNFLLSLSAASVGNTAVFVLGVFVIYAYLMGVPARQLWAPVACIALPLGILLSLFTFQYTRWDMAPITSLSGNDAILSLITGCMLLFATGGFVYTLHRAVKARFNAYLMHPALTPLIELALTAKALAIVLEGQATFPSLPFVSGRLLIVALPATMVVYYLYKALIGERTYLRQHQADPSARIHAYRFALAIILLIVVLVFFPSGLANSDFFRPH